MKKKALIYGLTAALLLAALTACSKPQADQPSEPEPAQAATSTPAPEDPTTTQEPATTMEPPAQTPAAPEQLSNEVTQELSGDELISYFQKVYDIVSEFHAATTPAEQLEEELEFLVDLTESDGKKLPSDYEAQYKAWRPVDEAPATTQTPAQQTSQNQGQTTQSQGQTQTTTQPATSTTKPSSGTSGSGSYDPYDGYGSYEAYIDAACKKYPQLSREEIMSRLPDQAGDHVNQELAEATASEGRLTGGGQ